MTSKIQKAIKRGDLVSRAQVLEDFDKEELVQIQEQARFIQVAMAIRKLRKNLGLSQTKLAQKMHVKREFISRLESGQQNITLDTLYKVAEATNKDFQFSFS